MPFIIINHADLVYNENSLKVLKIISGAKVAIVGVKDSALGANRSNGGGPLYMMGGDIGLSLDITMQCSSSSHQGNGSILSIN
jgi:hypothetical protein